MRSVGIDIGTHSIKIAEVEGSGRNFNLRDYLEIPFPPDLSQDRRVLIIDALRKIAAHFDPHSTRFVVSVSQDFVSVRRKTFPFHEKHKIAKSLPFELEDEIPFDPSNAIFDAKIIQYGNRTTDLLAVVCPLKQIQEIMILSQDAGIDPDVITVDGFALANLVTNWDEIPKTVSDSDLHPEYSTGDAEATQIQTMGQLFLHFGHNSTQLILLKGSELREIRSMNFGGMSLVSRIQKTYDISYAEALKGLQEKGFVLTKTDGASQDQIIFAKAISTGLDKFIFDLRKTILEFESDMDIKVSQIHMMGGVSQLINLAPYMTQKLGIVCNHFSHLDNGFKISTNETAELKKNSAIAIGIAIEGLKKPINPPINLRKGELAKEGRSLKQFWERWNTTVYYATAVFGVLFFYGIIKGQIASSIESQARSAVKKIAESPAIAISSKSNEINRYIREKKKEIADQKKLGTVQFINSPIDVITQASRLAPSKKDITLDVRHFKVENDDVIIEGEVSQKNHVDLLKAQLLKMAVGGKITDIRPTIPPAAGKVNFAFNLKFNRKPGAAE